MAETQTQKMKKADLDRAVRIQAKLEQAYDKAREARNLLYEAHALAVADTYQTVTDYDAPDIKDVHTALKIAATRPIIQLCNRWMDIVHGRREDLAEKC